MSAISAWIENHQDGVLSIWVMVAVIVGLWVSNLVLERVNTKQPGLRYRSQLVFLGLCFCALLLVVLTLPISPALRGQLLSLIGIVLSATVALSSTTFVGNAMAGIMLRALKNFRVGDFLEVGDHFGRVAETGLLHVEIQTEDRDLTTLPNLYLVQNPVKVIQSEGTIISAEVSLGYDIPHDRIENCLLSAAEKAELNEPFVHIKSLGDYSVVYRIAGLLTDVKRMLSTRSRLRALMIDELHESGIEIVSPSFMNQRVFKSEDQFVAPVGGGVVTQDGGSAESLAFHKAEKAESVEKRQMEWQDLKKQIETTRAELKAAEGLQAEALESELERLQTRERGLNQILQHRGAHPLTGLK